MAFKLECENCGEKLCRFCGECHQVNELDIHCTNYVKPCRESEISSTDFEVGYNHRG